MDFWKNKESRKILFILLGAISLAFLINVLFKLHMYGQRTTYAGESWLSTVSSIYIDNWLTEGITKLKFGMIRTFDSIEMRDLYDREVYASFLPGCLFLPYIIAKIFSLKPTLIYIESFASSYHYLGALLSGLISFLLCRKLDLSKNKIIWFSIFSGVAYIYSYTNFRILSFGYYTDTSIYLIYLFFLLTEFTKNTNTRLIQKSLLIFIGFFHEWYFISITLISIFAEINREGGKKRIGQILLFHLTPTLMALGIYVYHLQVLDKLEHSIYRMLRRSALNPVSGTKFDYSFADLWRLLFRHNKFIICFTTVLSAWNALESKFFKNNEVYKSLFIVAFGSPILQMLIALQHSAEHMFVSVKLLVPLGLFLPFFFEEVSQSISEEHRNRFITIALSFILFINLCADIGTLAVFKNEHPIYKKLETVFSRYSHEDLFFSYNLEILLDKYPKIDIKTSEKNVRPFDRVEGEPYLHYSARKQVYLIEEPEDIVKMLDNRNLHGKAKVHLISYINLCKDFKNKAFVQDLGDQMYIIDIAQSEINSPGFTRKYACSKKMKPRGYFGSS